MLNRGQHTASRFQSIAAFRLPDISERSQHARKTRTTVTVIAREIGSSEERLTIRRQNRSQRPSALPAHSLHGSLVTAVHIGPLIAIDLHRHKMFVDDLRERGIFIRFAVHYMAPVAPDRANIQQNGLVFTGRERKSL